MISRLNVLIVSFLQRQSNSGMVIFMSVVIAMLWANSTMNWSYKALQETEISIGLGDYMIAEPILIWVNDLLMSIFFLHVGLTLKKEILGGKLSSVRKALLPIGAAFGGMAVPAGIYLIFNTDTGAINGWGIPMATDIAFAIGVLSLFGDKIPSGLKVFLIALAIVDDLGSVLVIALFYTSDISIIDLLHGLLFFLLLIGGSLLGIRKAWFYTIIGIGGVWLAFFFSGVHPTTAGILIAFAIPGRVKIREEIYLKKLQELHVEFVKIKPIQGSFISDSQLRILEEIKEKSDDAETPLQKIEHQLGPFVGFIVLPVFALVNAGVHIHGDLLEIIYHPISLGIIFGLIGGKFLGIMGFSWILVKTGIAELPNGISWMLMTGLSLVAGIGFTMSFFITELAFTNPDRIFIAKLSILFTSVIAGILGIIVFWRYSKNQNRKMLPV